MQFKIPNKNNNNYGKTRIVKRFAVLPKKIYHAGSWYFVWLSWYNSTEKYRYNSFTNREDWYIESESLIIKTTSI